MLLHHLCLRPRQHYRPPYRDAVLLRQKCIHHPRLVSDHTSNFRESPLHQRHGKNLRQKFQLILSRIDLIDFEENSLFFTSLPSLISLSPLSFFFVFLFVTFVLGFAIVITVIIFPVIVAVVLGFPVVVAVVVRFPVIVGFPVVVAVVLGFPVVVAVVVRFPVIVGFPVVVAVVLGFAVVVAVVVGFAVVFAVIVGFAVVFAVRILPVSVEGSILSVLVEGSVCISIRCFIEIVEFPVVVESWGAVPPLKNDFLVGDVLLLVGFYFIFFLCDPAEKINLEGDGALDDPFDAISNGDDVADLDEVGIIALEESLDRSGFITNNTINHSDFLAGSGIDDPFFDFDNLDNDVVATSPPLQFLDFDEFGFVQEPVLSHKVESIISKI